MRIDLTGKVALVNAGSQGIGMAVAKGLSDAGAVVCITARTRDRLMAVSYTHLTLPTILRV